MRELEKYKIHTNYVYEIIGNFPHLFDTNLTHQVKIRDDVYPIFARLIDGYIAKIQQLRSSSTSE